MIMPTLLRRAPIVISALALTLCVTAPRVSAQTAAAPAKRDIIAEVRALIAKSDFDTAEKTLRAFAQEKGWTPDALEAISWMGRGNLAAKRLDEASRFAYETERLSLAALEKRQLDAEPHLPIALGAALEVQAQVLAQQGQRGEGVRLLERNLTEFGKTSIRARLAKNINLLSLEGKPAPAYETSEWVGQKPPTLASLKGKPVLLFFWAHWCPDCKSMAATLAELQSAYADSGLTIVAPTQRYGYVAKRAPAEPSVEMPYIGQVLKEFYGNVKMTVPVSADSFANYGSSTTPTVVVIDREGIVRLYHPGQMTKAELEPHIQAAVRNTIAR
jgi:thiol-disulfide isomerase/thioredoxin